MIKVSKKWILSLITVSLSALVVCVFFLLNRAPLSLELGSSFSSIPIEVDSYDIFDLGIVDSNQDQNLDIFTVNHSSRQSLLIGDGSGHFDKSLSRLGLSQDRQFPHLENSNNKPILDAPGLYIYRQYNILHIVAKDAEKLDSIDGTIQLSLPMNVVKQRNAQVVVEEGQDREITSSKIKFSLNSNGHLGIRAFDDIIEIPHRIDLNEAIPLNSIYVGIDATHPNSHEFDLMWRDRHNMAWADVNSDGKIDVFMGRGGAKGVMDELPETFYDELFVNGGERFEDWGQTVRLLKNACAARQAAWIDYDRDGLLDLYQGCSREANQLFKQQDDGSFIDVAPAVNLDLPSNGLFVWLDADDDGDLDVLLNQNADLALYFNNNSIFTPKQLGTVPGGIVNYSTIDYDLDGVLDIYVAGKEQSYLLRKIEDNYVLTNPESIGLPHQGLCANWVDYNNDGLTDLHVIPSGVYLQLPEHQFEQTELLSENAKIRSTSGSSLLGIKNEISEARCSWFDFNNDGFRDLLLSQMRSRSVLQKVWSTLITGDKNSLGKQWQTNLFKNNGNELNWLEIELEGENFLLQDFTAIVSLESVGSSQIQQIGSSEGSRFSQGHYRLYFGLGEQETVDSVTVIWSDGEEQSLNDIPSNQLITLKHP